MLRYVILAAASLAVARADVDYTDCRDHLGGYGETAECMSGYLPVGLCSSGRRADCAGHWTILKCCREVNLLTDKPETFACNTMTGSYGQYLECPAGRMVFGICTSGMYADCGNDDFTRMNCCDDHSQTIQTSCNWVHGNYGIKVECGTNQVMTGACTSGYQDNCSMSGGAYTGVKCCVLA